MKNFINYAKNRFLYGLLKLLIVFGIGLIASQFLFIPKVHAASIYDYSISLNGNTLNTTMYSYATAPNNTLRFDVQLNADGNIYTYFKTSLCMDVTVLTYYSSSTVFKNTYVEHTNIPCTYYNSSYVGGKIVNFYFNYDASNSASFTNTITFNMNDNASIGLLYFGASDQAFDLTSGLDNSAIIDQNEQIIDQNQTIIDNSSQTNEKLDETNDNLNDLNDNMTNEDYDTPDFSELEMADDTPISDLVLMPINYLNKLVSAFSNECRTYTIDFGIFKSNYKLSFPCIKAEKWLGSTLWNIIDVFACFFMIYEIGMLAVSAFNDFTSLRDTYDSLYTPKHGKPLGKHTSEVE